jgi:ABC-type transport system involved in multi-copper enzyme maturation permease subunit
VIWILLVLMVAIIAMSSWVSVVSHETKIADIESQEERDGYKFIENEEEPDLEERARALNAYQVCSQAMSNGLIFLIFLGMVMGGLSISGEDQLGTFRMTATRPVRRSELYWGKLITILGLFTTFYLLLVALSFMVASNAGTFGDVYDPEFGGIFVPATELQKEMPTALILGWLVLAAAIAYSVFISSVASGAGLSIALVLLIAYLSQIVIGALFPEFSSHLFTDYFDEPFKKVASFAQGFSDQSPSAEDPRVTRAFRVTAIWAGVMAILGWLRFWRRDILT